MKASSIAFVTAVMTVLTGMSWGIFMAISQDHSTMAAHAHLNLLGWVSLFLMGLFYKGYPALDLSKPARIQVMVWFVGSAVLALGVALIHTEVPQGEPIAAVSSLVLLADMVLFGVLVVRTLRTGEGGAAVPSPAE